MSWIHLEDLLRLIIWAATEPNSLQGALNAVSPHPVQNSTFTDALATALRRPARFPVPAFALRLLYGRMSEIILGSQRVVPRAALNAGFSFSFQEITEVFRDLLVPSATSNPTAVL
jgi:NAD dependent epimerase/dehydratase family enzyme